MVEYAGLPTGTREEIERIGSADLVIGLVGFYQTPELDILVPAIRDQVAALRGVSRAVLAYPADAVVARVDDVSADGRHLALLPHPLLAGADGRPGADGPHDPQNAFFQLGQSLGAPASVALSPGRDGILADSVARLVRPVLEAGLDLVTPCHARPRLEGLINNGLIYPLVRALYGKRVRCLAGSDFALSARLRDHLMAGGHTSAAAAGGHTLGSLVSEAAAGGFGIGQSHVGPWRPPALGGSDLSTVLALVLGPLLLAMERHAAFWQKVRGSQPVPTFGESAAVADEGAAVNVADMIRSCQLGCRNLQEVWGAVLPPATLLELGRLGRATPEQFTLPDDLWARIVYDFALGYRLRVMSRDHLLRSLTPLYLGWAASFILGAQRTGLAEIDQRIERLCLAYEGQKAYVIPRWRWPDRFNP